MTTHVYTRPVWEAMRRARRHGWTVAGIRGNTVYMRRGDHCLYIGRTEQGTTIVGWKARPV